MAAATGPKCRPAASRSQCRRRWSIGSSARRSSPIRRSRRRSRPSGDPDLKQALAWSKAVNESIEKVVRGVPPFPFVRECLEKLQPQADLFVVSATPNEALKREWEEHDLAKYVVAICGQEIGTKKESLANAKKYPADHTLMIGDAPGDYQAAVANDALFYPINPGAKKPVGSDFTTKASTGSWPARLPATISRNCLAEFDTYLPECRPGSKAPTCAMTIKRACKRSAC